MSYGHPLTEQQIAYITERWDQDTAEDIAFVLSLDPQTVRRRALRLGPAEPGRDYLKDDMRRPRRKQPWPRWARFDVSADTRALLRGLHAFGEALADAELLEEFA